LKILQVHNTYREAGGEDAVVRAEAELLEGAGHKVERFQVANPGGTLRPAANLLLSPWNPVAARRLGRLAERTRPDVAHVHNTWYSLSPSVLAALKRRGVPVVVTLHNYRVMCINGQLLRRGEICTLCVGSLPVRGLRYRCYRGSCAASAVAVIGAAAARVRRVWERDVDLYLVMSEFAKAQFVAAGLPEERIRVKPHFVADPGERSHAPSSSKTILYVGRLAREKGLENLLNAWRAASIAGCELLIVGVGPLQAELEARHEAGVRFLGWLPPGQVRRLMLSARALVFPSVWYETFGLTIAEAMAAGTPVLASDLGGTPELLGPLGAGWLVEADNTAAWASRLEAIASDAAALDEAGRQARKRYESTFSAKHGLRLLEDAYAAVARDR
jgi:glycosyltransferase involved in cell wall biosynthesis